MMSTNPNTLGQASAKLRKFLKENYVKVAPLSPKYTLTEYFRIAKGFYESGVRQLTARNFNGAYVDFQKFTIVIFERLRKHPDFNLNLRYVQELQKYIITTGNRTEGFLKFIVAQMDADELRKEMMEAAKADLDLMDEFDAPEPPPPPPPAPAIEAPPSAPVASLPVGASAPILGSSSLSSLNPYPEDLVPVTVPSAPTAPPSAPPAPVVPDLYAEVPDILYPYDGAAEPDPSTVDQSLSGLTGLNPNDLDILSMIPSYTEFYIPPPTNKVITFTIGGANYSFSQDDFHVSFDSFLNHLPVELQMARSATETNRCFFLHLGIATQIHPFVLQSTFRYYASRDLAQPDIWYGDIISTVNQYAGFVDANALSFLWPKEFDNYVICFISGPTNKPILSCFAPHGIQRGDPRLNQLTEVFIRCDGQHFTLMKPLGRQNVGFKMLSEILNIATNAGMLVQFNEVQPAKDRSVESAMRQLKNMS